MELWDVYDKDRNKTGRVLQRYGAREAGAYRLVVHVCVFNAKGEMLIQQRQPGKHGWPNLWDVTVGGAAVTGDSSGTAAEREIFEELGLRVALCDARPHLTVNFEGGFDDFYLVNAEVDLKTLRLQKDEVRDVRWAGQQEICAMIDAGIFIPYFKSLIALLFEMKNGYGSHSK